MDILLDKVQFHKLYSDLLAGRESDITIEDLTEDQYADWLEYVGEIGNEFTELIKDQEIALEKIVADAELPVNAKEWDIDDSILFLQSIKGNEYEKAFHKAFRQLDNTADLLEHLKPVD